MQVAAYNHAWRTQQACACLVGRRGKKGQCEAHSNAVAAYLKCNLQADQLITCQQMPGSHAANSGTSDLELGCQIRGHTMEVLILKTHMDPDVKESLALYQGSSRGSHAPLCDLRPLDLRRCFMSGCVMSGPERFNGKSTASSCRDAAHGSPRQHEKASMLLLLPLHASSRSMQMRLFHGHHAAASLQAPGKALMTSQDRPFTLAQLPEP